MLCPLCQEPSPSPVPFARGASDYFDCTACGFRFLDPAHRLSATDEQARYLHHENDPADEGYREYTVPLVAAIVASQGPESQGLDFGSGSDSAAYRMLGERGYASIARYDRFFRPDNSVLRPATYDFIYACEVVEHFHEPRAEFKRLRSMLRPGGLLALMTSLLTPEVDFENWHYRRDPTHVGFFSARSLGKIAQELGFGAPELHGSRLVLLRKGDA